jgi:hypothetical protein
MGGMAELTIRGYEREEGTSIIDAGDLMARPEFWPAYLSCFVSRELVLASFNQSNWSAVEAELLDRQRWPAFSLRLAPATRGLWRWLRVVYRNFPDDAGIDFLVTSDLGGMAIPVAAAEGHFRGPGLCWEELQVVAAMEDPVHSAAQRFVLSLPLLGDTGRPADARTVVAEALAAVGAVKDAGMLAGELLESPRWWSHAPWTIRQGVRMCLGHHTLRHVQDLSLNHLREVDLAFGGRYYRSRSGRREYGPREAGRTRPRWRFEVADSRVDGSGLHLRGHLDGQIRDGESARLVDGDSYTIIDAVGLGFEDRATGQLVLTIPEAPVSAPAAGASLHPIDADDRA